MKYIKVLSILFVASLLLVNIAMAQSSLCPSDPTNPGALCNPTGTGTFEIFIGNLFDDIAIVIGAIATGMVVISGFRMILSQGNEEAVTKAKTSLQWSIIGFIIVVLAFIIVSVVGNFFGAVDLDSTDLNTAIVDPIGSADYAALFQRMFQAALTSIGLVSIVFIIISGYRYITARGNEEQAESAKRGLTWAIAGLVIALLAYVIVMAILSLLGHDFTTTGGVIVPNP